EEKAIDVRILSASHKNLHQEVSTGHFREDLFYRINVIEIRVPALRERREDIPALVGQFLARFARESGLPAPRLAPDALRTLGDYPFPGNVRELENTLERAFTLCADGVITVEDLSLRAAAAPPPVAPGVGKPAPAQGYVPGSGLSLDEYLADIEREILVRVLEESRWNKTASAAKLGLSF